MAKQFNVLIFLVAHPKKNQAGKLNFTNDDVSGSSNITNLVDVVLRYDVPTKSENDENRPDRVLQVFKNRLTGRLCTDGIGLYYEESSKRISSNREKFDWTIGWEPKDDTSWHTVKDDGSEEVPF